MMPGSADHGLASMVGAAVRSLGAEPVYAGIGATLAGIYALLSSSGAQSAVAMPCQLLSVLRAGPASHVPLSLKTALLSADTCDAAILELLEGEGIQALYPHYGSRECGLGGAVTCKAFSGMHVRVNELYAEVLDEQGKQVGAGGRGELVFTTLLREAMPLVRYKTGDLATWLPGKCGCGSVVRRIADARRRSPAGMADIDALNALMFAERQVVDFKAAACGSGLKIEALTAGPLGFNLEALSAGISEITGMAVTLRSRPVQPGDKPMYAAKRVVEETLPLG
jgi:hypothetical protein